MKNNFFIVGAQRSGTTYLYTVLDEHPEICMAKPLKPEPKYFLSLGDEVFSYEKYKKKFFLHEDRNTKVYGEKSTSYYENENVAKLISSYLPNSKIVFILANPIDRAISNYKFSFENGIEKRSLKEVFIDNVKVDMTQYNTSVNPFNYLERGVYYKYLDIYYKYFPSKNIKVIIKEDFINNINNIKELYSFLECSNSFYPASIEKVINKSKKEFNLEEEYEVREFLMKYYIKYNKILKEKYSLNIEKWK